MKKFFSFLTVLVLAVSMMAPFPLTVVAETEVPETETQAPLWSYETYGEGLMLTAYQGEETDVYIPGQLEVDGEDYPVLKLADSLFENNDALNSATLGTGILEIGSRAFYDCDNLVCVLLNEQLTAIGDEVFAECDVFNSIILYGSVVTLGADLFKNCGSSLVIWCYQDTAGHQYALEHSLTHRLFDAEATPEIVVQDGVEYYVMNGQAYAIGYKGTATSVVIPSHINGYPVVELRETFKENTAVKSITLPKTLKIIGDYAFNGCTALQSIVIPESVFIIKMWAFSGSGLTSVEIPKGVKELGKNSFSGCDSLQTAIVREGVKVIGESAFSGSALLSVVIEDGTETLGQSAFYACRKLQSAVIGNGISSLEKYVFAYCDSLQSLTLPETVTLIKDYAFLYAFTLKDTEFNITLPDSVKSIEKLAFRAAGMTSLDLGAGVETLVDETFYQAPNLRYFQASEALTSVGARVFYECKKLEEVHFYDNVISIGDEAFRDCQQLRRVTMPAKLETLGLRAFWQCIKLESIELPDNIKVLRERTFYRCEAMKSIKLPKNLEQISTAGATLGSAFEECSSLKEIILPASVQKTGSYLFSGCRSLERFVMEEGSRIDGQGLGIAFYGVQVKYLSIAGSQKTVEKNVFLVQNKVETLLLGEGITKIETGIFTNATKLKSVLIPKSVTSIDGGAFYPTTIWLVHENSYAHTVARNNGLLFVIYDENSELPLETIDGVTYLIKEDSAEAVFYDGSVADVVMPETVQGKPLRKVHSIFKNSTAVTSVSIPDSVKTLSKELFYGCSNLVSVRLPSGLTEIVDYAFYNCAKLESVAIPSSVTRIGSYAFYGCRALTELKLPDKLKTIDSYGLAECAGLLAIQLPETVTTINQYAFRGCASLQTVSFPESVVTLGNGVLYGCSSLKSTVLPSSLQKIPASLFAGCSSLETLPDLSKITHIGAYAFDGCTAIKELVIPANVIDIGYGVFANTGVEEVVIPETVQSYAGGMFKGCKNLKKATLPQWTQTIGPNLFDGCISLETLILPEGITSLGSYTFRDCVSLKQFEIPAGVTAIGSFVFAGCTGFTEISIPDTVTSLGESAFQNCTNLKKVQLPEGLLTIGKNAFIGCDSLGCLLIPQSVTSIVVNSFPSYMALQVYEDSYAHQFAEKNGWTYILATGEDITEIVILDGCRYYVADNRAVLYYYDGDATELVIPAEVSGYPVTEIRDCFKNNTVLTSVVLPETLEIIGESAFENCKALIEVQLPDSLKVVEGNAFYDCQNLKTISIPQNIEVIGPGAFHDIDIQGDLVLTNLKELGEGAFWRCHNLTSVSISGSDLKIGTGAFSHCNRITSVVLENVQVIGDRAFAYCSELESIELPEGLIEIGNSAFYASTFYASQLRSIELPDSLTTLGRGAFSNSSLRSIQIPAKVKVINEDTFSGTRLEDGVVFLGEIEEIKSHAFSSCRITEFEIPKTVKKIEANVFASCTELVSVKLHDDITEIGNSAFSGCSKLETMELPQSLTAIGVSAFKGCTGLKELSLPQSVATIGESAFENCTGLTEVSLPDGLQILSQKIFANCTNLEKVILGNGLTEIQSSAFLNDAKVEMVYIPDSVAAMTTASFPASVILLVNENSYAHTFAVENDLLYFVLHQVENPEISYGTGISGSVAYFDGTVAAGSSVSLLDSNGLVKETVIADAEGNYEFTYAEVGSYTIKAVDGDGNASTTRVSVKRKNIFDVFLAGDTDLLLQKGWKVSGTVLDAATVTLMDEDGNAIASLATEDGTFCFENVSNGTYILKAENANGMTAMEITVFGGDLTDLNLVIEKAATGIWGYVEVQARDEQRHRRNWVEVTIYDENGIAVDRQKSDRDGKYQFDNLPLGSYSIVAETAEMRQDKNYHYDRNHKLTGYAYVTLSEETMVQAETIVLYEENEHLAKISGKVTAQGETQDCKVTLHNVFRHEIAQLTTGKNGKYCFENVRDGLYFITAVTNSDGMGYAVIVVLDGKVYGDTDITVYKTDKIKKQEDDFFKEVPECKGRDDVAPHRERIAKEKKFYDGLSDKEKKQLSKEYVDRLNRYAEWLADCEYATDDDVVLESGGLVISDEELAEEKEITFNLNVEKKENYKPSGKKVETDEDFIFHEMEEASKGKKVKQYYEITMTKTVDGEEQTITSVCKETKTTGKFRITMRIPEEYRGFKHYSIMHVHKGEVVTLTDLDDDPDTITFEVDKFSTFALAATNETLTYVEECDHESMGLDEDGTIICSVCGMNMNISGIYSIGGTNYLVSEGKLVHGEYGTWANGGNYYMINGRPAVVGVYTVNGEKVYVVNGNKLADGPVSVKDEAIAAELGITAGQGYLFAEGKLVDGVKAEWTDGKLYDFIMGRPAIGGAFEINGQLYYILIDGTYADGVWTMYDESIAAKLGIEAGRGYLFDQGVLVHGKRDTWVNGHDYYMDNGRPFRTGVSWINGDPYFVVNYYFHEGVWGAKGSYAYVAEAFGIAENNYHFTAGRLSHEAWVDWNGRQAYVVNGRPTQWA